MKRIFLLILFLLLSVSAARATAITVSGTQVNNSQLTGSTCSFRLYASGTFTDSLGIRYIGGAVGTGNFFSTAGTCTVAGNIASIGSLSIPSTLDSIDNPQVRYTAVLYNSKGVQAAVYLANFAVPVSPTTTTWAQIIQYNAAPQRAMPAGYYTTAQVDALFGSLTSAAQKASNVLIGVSRLSTAPADSSDPVVVGANDASVTSKLYVDKYASLSAALADSLVAGGSPASMVISTDEAVAASLTIPANVTLEFTNTGKLTVASGQTVTIAGGLVAPQRGKVFDGAGTVKFSAVPDVVYPEWFGVVSSASEPSAGAQTENVAAFARALDAVTSGTYGGRRAGSGTIRLASGKNYYFNDSIDLTGRYGITVDSPDNAKAALIYTPTTNPGKSATFIKLDSALNITFRNFRISAPTSQYVGDLVTANKSASYGNKDASNLNFENMIFGSDGENSSYHANSLLWLNFAIVVKIADCRFGYAKAGIVGRTAALAGVSSNVVLIQNNTFTGMTEAAIKNAFESWTIEQNTVEAFSIGKQTLYKSDYGVPISIVIRNNWVGDQDANQGVPIISGIFYNPLITGNRFATWQGGAETAPAIKIDGGSTAVNILSNRIDSPVAMEFGTPVNGQVLGNDLKSGATITNASSLNGAFKNNTNYPDTDRSLSVTGLLQQSNVSGVDFGYKQTAFASDATNTSGEIALLDSATGAGMANHSLALVAPYNAGETAIGFFTYGAGVRTKRAQISSAGLATTVPLSIAGGTALATTNQTGTGNLVLATHPTINSLNAAGEIVPSGTASIDFGQKTTYGSNILSAQIAVLDSGIGAGITHRSLGIFSGWNGAETPIYFFTPTAGVSTKRATVSSAGVVATVPFSSSAGVSNFALGSAVASAASITPTGNLFHVTGAVTITSISTTGIAAGTEITIIFDGAAQMTDGSNLKLNGNFTGAADRVIKLAFDGTNYYEVSRSAN